MMSTCQPMLASLILSLAVGVWSDGLAAYNGGLCNISLPEDIDYFRPEWGLRGPHLASKRNAFRKYLNGMRVSGVVWYDGFVMNTYHEEYYENYYNQYVDAGTYNGSDPCQRITCTDLAPSEYPLRYQNCLNGNEKCNNVYLI